MNTHDHLVAKAREVLQSFQDDMGLIRDPSQQVAEAVVAAILPNSQAQRLSRMLFHARESIDMFTDVVEARTGKTDSFNRDLRDEIDAYREEQGWSPDGFGGEEG